MYFVKLVFEIMKIAHFGGVKNISNFDNVHDIIIATACRRRIDHDVEVKGVDLHYRRLAKGPLLIMTLPCKDSPERGGMQKLHIGILFLSMCTIHQCDHSIPRFYLPCHRRNLRPPVHRIPFRCM